MMIQYKATLIKIAGRKVKENVVKDAVIVDGGKGAYPYTLYIAGQYIGKGKTIEALERLAKHNFELTYKIEKIL